MNEEAKLIVDTLRYCEESGARCGGCPSGTNEQGIPNCHSQSNIADLIESLSEQLDQVTRERDAAKDINVPTAQPKWISVKERLPDDEVDVLVYIASKKENVDSVIAITHYTHTMHGYNIEGWCSPWQYCFWDREVTHWMPLPEPPKEDE